MNEYLTYIDDLLKDALLSNIIITIDGNNYKEGVLISFTHNFYNLNLILKNKRKIKNDILKIPLPFDVQTDKKIIIFDYRVQTFSKNNKNIEKIINDLKKPCISKFYDKILSIEVN